MTIRHKANLATLEGVFSRELQQYWCLVSEQHGYSTFLSQYSHHSGSPDNNNFVTRESNWSTMQFY